jgi:hypothetical protein
MATLRRGLVDTVKKAAAKAGTRGARALVETTVAAVKTVDKLQEKLGRRSSQARSETSRASETKVETKPAMKASRSTGRASTRETLPTRGMKDVATPKAAPKDREAVTPKSRRTPAVAQPMAQREAGRKTMPAAAPKRSKAPAQTPGFKVKRGQKHRHTGR